MSEKHYIRCDWFRGPGGRGACHYRADHRFVPSHPDADQAYTRDACEDHAAEYRDDPNWKEVPLPEIDCEARIRALTTRAEEAEALLRVSSGLLAVALQGEIVNFESIGKPNIADQYRVILDRIEAHLKEHTE